MSKISIARKQALLRMVRVSCCKRERVRKEYRSLRRQLVFFSDSLFHYLKN